jgi:hypothetical protein
MDVIGFLCVSLGSSTVQLHDSLGSRHACTCSEASFSSQNCDRAWGEYYRRAEFCCAFFMQQDSTQRIFIKQCILFMLGSVCCVVAWSGSQLGWEILSRSFESCRWCLTRSPCWDCNRSNCAADRRVDSSWLEDKDRQCSNCTWVFPWFSIQHNARLIEVSESVRMVGAQRTEGPRKNEPCNISYDMQMKKICSTGLLLGTIHGCIIPNPNQRVLQCKWKHPSSPATRKFKVTPSAGKVLLTVFWDSQGVLLADFRKCD